LLEKHRHRLAAGFQIFLQRSDDLGSPVLARGPAVDRRERPFQKLQVFEKSPAIGFADRRDVEKSEGHLQRMLRRKYLELPLKRDHLDQRFADEA
jgi:hypothetical protein